MNEAEIESAAGGLVTLVDTSIERLFTLRRAHPLDGQISRVDFSIRKCNVAIKNERTLDVEVIVKPQLKQAEYASMFDYWIDAKQRLTANIDPGLKAKEAYELLYAVQLFDNTVKRDGNASRERAAVQAALEGLVNLYTSRPAKPFLLLRYQGRDSKTSQDSQAHQFHQSMFLAMNKDALHSLLFSQKEVIDQIDSKSVELAAGGEYKTTLHDVADGENYRITPKNAIEEE